jgi:DNA topoisomerase-1
MVTRRLPRRRAPTRDGGKSGRRGKPGRRRQVLPPPDPEEAAKAAGLVYVRDDGPGIRRNGAKRFTYVGPDGRAVRDRATLDRIRSLAIPPAYIDVWICPDPRGHIQATGRDVRGRKQYRYHPRWREVRDETKFGRMLAFSEALPRIREQVERDLGLPGHPREKVLAAVVHLLDETGIRVGNDEYARTNRSFGLTTLRDDHVKVTGAQIRFSFRGKSGKVHVCKHEDRRLARIVRRCQELPGEELFQYEDDEGKPQTIGSADVNEYLRNAAGGEEFTAKDFRTWRGTLLAVGELKAMKLGETARETRANVLRVVDRVAEGLNNTRAVCRKYYIHPCVLETYEGGTLLKMLGDQKGAGAGAGSTPTGLKGDEPAVVRLLQAHQRAAAAAA